MTALAWFFLVAACVLAFTSGALYQRVKFYQGLYEHFKESYKEVYSALREERQQTVALQEIIDGLQSLREFKAIPWDDVKEELSK